jgi:hypothetical protein
VQEPVLRLGALDHNVVGKLEATLEGPLGEVYSGIWQPGAAVGLAHLAAAVKMTIVSHVRSGTIRKRTRWNE